MLHANRKRWSASADSKSNLSFTFRGLWRNSPLSSFSVFHWQCITDNKYLSQQQFCCDKHIFVTTNVLLRQAYFSCDKRCVLPQTFVMTKMILVAPPANDTCVILLWLTPFCLCPPPPHLTPANTSLFFFWFTSAPPPPTPPQLTGSHQETPYGGSNSCIRS